MEKLKEFQLESKTDNLTVLNEYLEQLFESLEIPMNVSYAVEVCLEEIFVNICHYAYGEDVGMIDVTIETDEDGIEITLKDSGIPYDPLKKTDPDINASIEDRPIGGLGIFMTKKMLDKFEYDYSDGKNVNILGKKF